MNSDSSMNSDDATSKGIKILTFNTFIRPPFISTENKDYRDERIDLFDEMIFKYYDIIAFQEMFSFLSDRVERVIKLAKEHGILYHWRSPKNSLWKFASDGGLLILSKYPIVEHDIQKLIRGIHGDFFSDKSVIYAKIEILPQRYIHLFTSHVQASYSDYPHIDKSKSVRIRLTQLTEIRDFIHHKTTNSNISEPIILMGDLNVNSRLYEKNSTFSSKEYKIMMDIFSGKRSFYYPSVDLCGFCCGWCDQYFKVKRIKCYPDENDELNDTFKVYDLVKYFLDCHPNTSCKIFSKDYYKDNNITKVKKSLDYVFLFDKIDKNYKKAKNSTTQIKPEIEMINDRIDSFENFNLFLETSSSSSSSNSSSRSGNSTLTSTVTTTKSSNSKEEDSLSDDETNNSFYHNSGRYSISSDYSNIPKKKLSLKTNFNNESSDGDSVLILNKLKLNFENNLNYNSKEKENIQKYLHEMSEYYKITNLKLQNFKVENKPFEYLSDHYGIEFNIEIFK